jgi:hypothetical protein
MNDKVGEGGHARMIFFYIVRGEGGDVEKKGSQTKSSCLVVTGAPAATTQWLSLATLSSIASPLSWSKAINPFIKKSPGFVSEAGLGICMGS